MEKHENLIPVEWQNNSEIPFVVIVGKSTSSKYLLMKKYIEGFEHKDINNKAFIVPIRKNPEDFNRLLFLIELSSGMRTFTILHKGFNPISKHDVERIARCYVDWYVYKDPMHCKTIWYFNTNSLYPDDEKEYMQLPCKKIKDFMFRSEYREMGVKNFKSIFRDKILTEHFLKQLGLESGAIYCPRYEEIVNEILENFDNAVRVETIKPKDKTLLKENTEPLQALRENKEAIYQENDSSFLNIAIFLLLIIGVIFIGYMILKDIH